MRVPTQSVTLLNSGHTPVSFHVPRSELEGSGFSVEMVDKVRSLPPGETLAMEISFDSTLIKVMDKKTSATLHFNVSEKKLKS